VNERLDIPGTNGPTLKQPRLQGVELAHDISWNEKVCANTANSLNILRWARKKGYPWGQDTGAATVHRGRTEVRHG